MNFFILFSGISTPDNTQPSITEFQILQKFKLSSLVLYSTDQQKGHPIDRPKANTHIWSGPQRSVTVTSCWADTKYTPFKALRSGYAVSAISGDVDGLEKARTASLNGDEEPLVVHAPMRFMATKALAGPGRTREAIASKLKISLINNGMIGTHSRAFCGKISSASVFQRFGNKKSAD